MNNSDELNNGYESEQFTKEKYDTTKFPYVATSASKSLKTKEKNKDLVSYAKEGNLKEIKQLSKEPFAFNIKEAALRQAIINNHVEVTEYLIEHEASLHTANFLKLRKAAFRESVKYNNDEIFEYLIMSKLNVELTRDIGFLNSLLVESIQNSNLKIATELLYNGADVNCDSGACLMIAVVKNDMNMVKFLKKHGVDMHRNDNEALKYAMRNEKNDIIKYLINNTVVNILDDELSNEVKKMLNEKTMDKYREESNKDKEMEEFHKNFTKSYNKAIETNDSVNVKAKDDKSLITKEKKIDVIVIDDISDKFNEKLETMLDNKVEKKSYFNIFKNLGSYVNNLMLSYTKRVVKFISTTPSENINMTPEQKLIFDKVELLITNNILTEVIRIEKSGYVLTKGQKLNFEKALEDSLLNGKVNQVRDLLSEEYKIPLTILAKWILNTKGTNDERELFSNELNYVWKDTDVVSQILIEWEKELTGYLNQVKTSKLKLNENSQLNSIYYTEEIASFTKTTNKVVSIFNKLEEAINVEQYISILSLIKEKINIQKQYLEDGKKKQDKEYLKASYQKVLDLVDTSNNVVDKMTSQINSCYQNKRVKEKQLFKIEVKELSSNTKELLENLNTQIEECKKEREKIPDYEWERLESLWKTNLNKALNDYSAMSKEAKENLKNVEKKSADELLDETILHISDILENKLLEINEDRLSSLSIGQRHVKSLKNNF